MANEALNGLIQSVQEKIPPSGRGLIFTHNNPDPDSIGAACGLQFYLKKLLGRETTITFGGIIRRSENRQMIRMLGLRMTPFRQIDPKKFTYAILVDTQPGSGNNRYHGTPPLFLVLDHHHPERKASRNAIIHLVDSEKFGSASTIVCSLLKQTGLQPTRKLATALLYGIKVDTLNLERGSTRLDEEMYRFASSFADNKKLSKIENVRISIKYFREYYQAIEKAKVYKDAVIVEAGGMSNPDMTAELADLFARLENIHWTLVLGRFEDMVLFSLRSDAERRNTGDMAVKIAKRIGTAGGHNRYAGGQIRVKGGSDEAYLKMENTLKEKFLKILKLDTEEPQPFLLRGE